MKLSDPEREKSAVLIVEPELFLRNRLRTLIQSLGFGAVSDASDHKIALERFRERNFTHILFSTQQTSLPALDFLRRARLLDDQVILIPMAQLAQGEEIFELLQQGARGFLMHPLDLETLDDALALATVGKPIPDSILKASDRNEALAALMSASLNEAARLLKESRRHSGAAAEFENVMGTFRRSAKIARTFAKDGAAALLRSVTDFFVKRADLPSTRLGRLRKRLQSERSEKHREKH